MITDLIQSDKIYNVKSPNFEYLSIKLENQNKIFAQTQHYCYNNYSKD